jgi:hypothetical protein
MSKLFVFFLAATAFFAFDPSEAKEVCTEVKVPAKHCSRVGNKEVCTYYEETATVCKDVPDSPASAAVGTQADQVLQSDTEPNSAPGAINEAERTAESTASMTTRDCKRVRGKVVDISDGSCGASAKACKSKRGLACIGK